MFSNYVFEFCRFESKKNKKREKKKEKAKKQKFQPKEWPNVYGL